MGGLKNNTTLAVERATALARAIESLSNSGQISKDSQSTISGNRNAHDAIDLAQRTAIQMNTVISAMSQNINHLSSAFHAMDQRAAAQLSRLEDASKRFRLND